jgi:predicted nucleic acid-binding protein
MAALIFDASGIVKRYVIETGSAWVQAQSDPAAGHEIFLTRIGRVEVTAAIARRGKGPLLPGVTITGLLTQFRYDLAHQYNILEIPPALLSAAERLAELHALRGYDAVQLAAAIVLHRARQAGGLAPLTLVSADGDLNTAAAAEGLAVENPNMYP